MASFEKRSGSWRVTVRKGGVRKTATFATKAQAAAWAMAIEAEVASVAAGVAPVKTVREALEKYLAEEAPKRRGCAWESVRLRGWLGHVDKRNGRVSRQVLPWLDRPLAEIGADVLAEWRNDRLQLVSTGSVRREMNLMGSVLAVAAREWRWIKANPLAEVRRPPMPAHRTRRITDDEIRRITLALGWEDGPVGSLSCEVAAAFLLAIETAMRIGELLALRWEDVDLVRRVARLRMTKNGTARDVPLSREALRIFGLLQGRDPSRVFTVPAATADVLFRRAKASAQVADLHFHDSRREATSRLAKRVDVLTLARITGHKDVRMLMIYYQTDMADVALQIG